MNLYVTSGSPIQSALVVDDLNTSRHIWWTGQILSTALAHYDKEFCKKHKLVAYSNNQHSIIRWTRESRSNFLWTVIHGLTLLKQYKLVEGRESFQKDHILIPASRHMIFPDKGLTEFIPETWPGNPEKGTFEKYKFQMSFEWDTAPRQPTWKNREVPSFWGKFK